MEYEVFMYFVSFTLSISFVTMLAACLCCRKKVPKNELLGLEGMVKLKNPDDNIVNGNSGGINSIPDIPVDFKPNTNTTETDSKRVSAPHRSLPDIPVSDPILVSDTGSELYATVGDKVIQKPQGRSPNTSVKKLASISQHSSISQADDISSPYARVRSPSHAYDKVRQTEHPYAQVSSTTSGNGSGLPRSSLPTTQHQISEDASTSNGISSGGGGGGVGDHLSSAHGSQESLLGNGSGGNSGGVNGNGSNGENIPAASAIAGRISASQELPYMTPPIVQQPHQHFSGDSQDSSKGYTSISVREPLANILAQTNQQNAHQRRRDLTDSHYATVSDDSDEMYAAIDDPNTNIDLYTSGSETYAQIQPQIPLTVAVEINITPRQKEDDVMKTSTSSNNTTKRQSIVSNIPTTTDDVPIQSVVDNFKSAHSREASCSSCTNSIANLGSPKPEKRQANSPLPPTPKNSNHFSNSNLNNNTSSIPSSRNSVTSVIECQMVPTNSSSRHVSRENLTSAVENDLSISAAVTAGGNLMTTENKSATLPNLPSATDEDSTKKKNPSRNLEGMYAKVMKKNKLSNAPSQSTSPVPFRKSYNYGDSNEDQSYLVTSDAEIITLTTDSTQQSINPMTKSLHLTSTHLKGSTSSSSRNKTTNDYESIDKHRNRSNSYDTKDPGYETIPAAPSDNNKIPHHHQPSKIENDISEMENEKSRVLTPAGNFAHGKHIISQNSLILSYDLGKNNNNNIIEPIDINKQIGSSIVVINTQPLAANVQSQLIHLPTTALNPSSLSFEPKYESLPDKSDIKITDPTYYEIVKQQSINSCDKIINKSNSDYDPNYETVRPSTSMQLKSTNDNNKNVNSLSHDSNGFYTKVWDQSNNNKTDLNDGYSTIKPPAIIQHENENIDNGPNYSTVDEIDSLRNLKHHDYARITTTNTNENRNYLNNNKQLIDDDDDDDEASDIYASITTTTTPTSTTIIAEPTQSYLNKKDNSLSDHKNNLIISESISGYGNNEISNITSEHGINQSHNIQPNILSISGYSLISDITTPTTSNQTPSSGSNCSDTQIGYSTTNSSNSFYGTNIDQTNRLHEINNYESLTESESDPNYESVKYVNVTGENLYERLYNDSSCLSPDNPSTKVIAENTVVLKVPVVLPQITKQFSSGDENALTETATTSTTISKTTTTTTTTTKNPSEHNLEVSDYFQV